MKISFLMLFFGFVFASAEINVESAAPDENLLKSVAVPDEVKDHNDANIAVDELVAEDDNKNNRDSIDGADSDDDINNNNNTDNDDDEDVSDSDNTDDDNDDDGDDVNGSDNADDFNDSDNTDEVDPDDEAIEGDNDIEDDDDAFDDNNVGLSILASVPFNRRYLPHRYRYPWPIQTRRYVTRLLALQYRVSRQYRRQFPRSFWNCHRFRSKTPRRYRKYGSRRQYRTYGSRCRYRSRRYRSRRYRG